ncbi:FRG domain-containing protein [Pedobacter steynii]|uniref:FRG domain-containing protein n=1 Tax=Pedobacter steynii TaxID=430522 RepID=A0A1D7QKJ0_9SPHI|nr:FRG domain-containing protein [Pedobacter steynii]AOM79194.1 hypothetical protein BFS30_19695 [Pedobacter steynii]
MHKADKTINNLTELLELLKEDSKDIKTPIWFRGHANIGYKLIPGLFRYSKAPVETNLIEKFKQNATMLLNNNHIREIDWLFIMQHNGVPTRLLDWSESPLVALYFACSSDKKKDGALNMLLPIELNKKASIKQNYIVSINDTAIEQRYSPEAYKSETTSEMFPVAIICPRNSARIQAQAGTFTIFHRDKTPIEMIDGGKHVWRYKIPASSKDSILKELDLFGIDEFRLFPELPSLGSILKRNI